MEDTGPFIYAASVIGAVALYILIAPRTAWGRTLKAAAVIFGLGAFGYLIQSSVNVYTADADQPAGILFIIFSVIAIASAVRMITHHRPVYCALYFVLTVLSSAALFLILEAEFMAFALIIVYAGAILVTYMFVLMFAQQSSTPPSAGEEHGIALYDRIPREPAAACFVGFIMLALLTSTALYTPKELSPPTAADSTARLWETYEPMPRRQVKVIRLVGEQFSEIEADDIIAFNDPPNRAVVLLDGSEVEVVLPADHLPSNIRTVGMDLVYKFPVSLELAGVILLLAMFGAVVLARRQIELSEDEKRAAAGLGRLSDEEDEEPAPPGGSTGGGA